jgi:hypothetical protein
MGVNKHGYPMRGLKEAFTYYKANGGIFYYSPTGEISCINQRMDPDKYDQVGIDTRWLRFEGYCVRSQQDLADTAASIVDSIRRYLIDGVGEGIIYHGYTRGTYLDHPWFKIKPLTTHEQEQLERNLREALDNSNLST